MSSTFTERAAIGRSARLDTFTESDASTHKRSVGETVRRFCLECVGAANPKQAFDCLSRICPFRESTPFRGKPRPKTLAPERGVSEGEREREREEAGQPKRRATKADIARYCRGCQPGDMTDCGATEAGLPASLNCALYFWRPWRPGGQPKTRKVKKAERERLRAIGEGSRFQDSRQRRGGLATALAGQASGERE